MRAKKSKLRSAPKTLAFLAICALAGSGEAKAEKLWSWSYQNPESKVSAAGTLTTKDLAAGSYEITAIAGAWNGAAITGLEAIRSCCSPPGWNDNLLLEGSPPLDKAGLALSANGGLKINLFYKDGHYAYEIENGPEAFGGDFTAAPVDRQ